MKRLFLKPVAGRACPDPANGGALLLPEGAYVPHTVYWQRRLNAGDAVLSTPEEAAPVEVLPEATAPVEAPLVKKVAAKQTVAAGAGGEQ